MGGILRPLPDGILGIQHKHGGPHGLDTAFKDQEYVGIAQFKHDFNNAKSRYESETGDPLAIEKVKHASGERLPHLAFLRTDRFNIPRPAHTKSCGQEIVKIDAGHNDFLTDPSVVAK